MGLERLRHLYLRRVVAPLLGVVGHRATQRLAVALARRVHDLNTPARRIAEQRFRSSDLFVHANDVRTHEVVRGMYEHIGRFWSESLFLRRRLHPSSWQQHVEIGNRPELEALAAEDRGCIFATACFGNPAVAAIALGHLYRPIHVLVDYLHQPALRDWQKELYSLPNVRPIVRQDASNALPRVLRGGGAVMMLVEHERRRGRAVETRFLGAKLRCYPTAERLAKWHNVPIIPMTCRRGDRPFTFVVETHGRLNVDPHTATEGAVTSQMMASLERAILRCPEQYMWSVGAATAATAPRPEARNASGALANLAVPAASSIPKKAPRADSPGPIIGAC